MPSSQKYYLAVIEDQRSVSSLAGAGSSAVDSEPALPGPLPVPRHSCLVSAVLKTLAQIDFSYHLPTSRFPLVVFKRTTWMEAFLSYLWIISWMWLHTERIGPQSKKISRQRFPIIQLFATRSLSTQVPWKLAIYSEVPHVRTQPTFSDRLPLLFEHNSNQSQNTVHKVIRLENSALVCVWGSQLNLEGYERKTGWRRTLKNGIAKHRSDF